MHPRPIAPAPPRPAQPSPLLNRPPPVAASESPSPPIASTSAPSSGKAKKQRRSKVAEACRFCRRSHMSCDAGRPCGRCVKRDIAHLCREEPLPSGSSNGDAGGVAAGPAPAVVSPSPGISASPAFQNPISNTPTKVAAGAEIDARGLGENTLGLEVIGSTSNGGENYSLNASNNAFDNGMYSNSLPTMALNSNFNLAMLDLASGQDGMGAGLGLGDPQMDNLNGEGSEFHGLGLSEFLQSLNDNAPFLSSLYHGPLPASSHASTSAVPQAVLTTSHLHPSQQQNQHLGPQPNTNELDAGMLGDKLRVGALDEGNGASFGRRHTAGDGSGVAGIEKGAMAREINGSGTLSPPITKTERFLHTAADQVDGSRSDRLARVIHAKFEAGLLRPYNHVAGYTRLMRWMADNMSAGSRQRTLQTLSEFRPTFRAIASGLTDLDLVFIEEAFERLLLDYDRVFSSMGIPSCLWRRTGEIYKGNKEFAALVGVPIEQLREGKLAIYELMAEESAVNYWEKYGDIAFDAGQKAVLTSCVLINQSALSRKVKRSGNKGEREKAKQREDCMINCCFSFTIRRDSYAIPSMIVGNFLRF